MSIIRNSAWALAAIFVAVFLLALPASAQTAAFSFTSNAYGVTDNAIDTGATSYNLGYEFTVGANPVTVTALGFFNEPSFDPTNSFNTVNLNPEPAGTYTYVDDHPVGIYDLSGNLLASADVTSSSTANGDFLYTALSSSLTLDPGSYIIAGVTGSQDPFMFNVEDDTQPGDVGLVSSSPITWDEDVATQGSDLTAFPGLATTDGNGPGYFGPNFEFTVVPESGSLALILPGLLALVAVAVVRRRRLKSNI